MSSITQQLSHSWPAFGMAREFMARSDWKDSPPPEARTQRMPGAITLSLIDPGAKDAVNYSV